MIERFRRETAELIAALADSAALEPWYSGVLQTIELLRAAFDAGQTVYVAGNGGSATLAQHLADEMVGRYKADRPPLPVVSLTADSAVLTCIGNDFGFEQVFARQIEALGRKGDVLIALSTSGSSPNVLAACQQAGDAKPMPCHHASTA